MQKKTLSTVSLAAYYEGKLVAECTLYSVTDEKEYEFFFDKFNFCHIDIDIAE